MLEPGTKAPAFTLTGPAGEKVSLKDFAGRDVILYFYPRDDTPGCTKEACGFRDAWDELRELGAVVLGVSADDADSHQRFAAKYRLPFTLLSDPDRSVMTAYGAYGEKTMYGKKVDRGHPLDRLDRSRRTGPPALGQGGQCGRAPGEGARGAPRGRMTAVPRYT